MSLLRQNEESEILKIINNIFDFYDNPLNVGNHDT